MARVTKVLVRPGQYRAPMQKPDGTRVLGTLEATEARVQRWARQFAAMKRAGIRVPICWGHQADALPGEGEDKGTRQYKLAASNAGYIEEMSIDPETGAVRSVLDIPGASGVDADGNLLTEMTLPDGRKVKTAIKEVSVAIRDWTDGSGKKWDDSIVHVALVTHPVMGGQDGFGAAEMATGGFYLSLADMIHGTETATEESTMPGTMDMPDVSGPTGSSQGGQMTRVLGILQRAGIHLPPDTNSGNMLERLEIAGYAVQKYQEANGGGDGGGLATTDDESGLGDDDGMVEMDDDGLGDDGGDFADDDMGDDSEMDEGEDVPDEDMGEGGEEAEVSGDSDDIPGEDEEGDEDEDEDAQEEPRPTMMSTEEPQRPRGQGGRKSATAGLKTPMERALGKEMVRSVREKRKAKLAKLIRQGYPHAEAQKLYEKIDDSPVRLARKGDEVVSLRETVDIELSTIESVYASGVVAPPQKGKRARRPTAGRKMEDDPEIQKMIADGAASVSTPRGLR